MFRSSLFLRFDGGDDDGDDMIYDDDDDDYDLDYDTNFLLANAEKIAFFVRSRVQNFNPIVFKIVLNYLSTHDILCANNISPEITRLVLYILSYTRARDNLNKKNRI